MSDSEWCPACGGGRARPPRNDCTAHRWHSADAPDPLAHLDPLTRSLVAPARTLTVADRAIDYIERDLRTPLENWQCAVIRTALSAEPEVIAQSVVAKPRDKDRGPKCGCGHLIPSHLADGTCLGCTGVCDSGPFVLPVPPRKRANPEELAAIRTLRRQITEELTHGSPEYVSAQIRLGAVECATHEHTADGACVL